MVSDETLHRLQLDCYTDRVASELLASRRYIEALEAYSEAQMVGRTNASLRKTLREAYAELMKARSK